MSLCSRFLRLTPSVQRSFPARIRPLFASQASCSRMLCSRSFATAAASEKDVPGASSSPPGGSAGSSGGAPPDKPSDPRDPDPNDSNKGSSPTEGADSPGADGFSPEDEKISALELQLQEQKEQYADLLSKYRYAQADFENSRKRHVADMATAKDYAVTKLAKTLVEVADNLERALESAKDKKEAGSTEGSEARPGGSTDADFYQGVQLTDEVLLKILKDQGVTKFDPLGEKFDPNFHEAMFQVESEEPKDTIVHVMQKGWKIKDRMLRAARVGTSSGKKA